MLVPAPAVSAADVTPALEDAGVLCWCLNRQGQFYVELLRAEFAEAPKIGGESPRLVDFRGALDVQLATSVGVQGRRSLAFLPREDVRQFTQIAETRLNFE